MKFEIRTVSDENVDCRVSQGTKHVISVRNYRPNTVELDVESESRNDRVKFDMNGSFSTEWSDSDFVNPRAQGQASTEQFSKPALPNDVSQVYETLSTDIECTNQVRPLPSSTDTVTDDIEVEVV